MSRGSQVAALSRAAELLREALASARSQGVASLLTVAMVAGMCLAALLTTGRTVAAEQAVLAEIDSVGTRSIVVRAEVGSEVTAELLDRLSAVTGVEAVTGFGPVIDARNVGVSGGPPVPIRRGYGKVGDRRLLAVSPMASEELVDEIALASTAGQRALGLHDGTGVARTEDGQGVVVVGDLSVPAHLRFLEPLVVIPSSTAEAASSVRPDEPLAVLVVLARSPTEVVAVERVLRGMLSEVEPGRVTVETAAELTAIRAAVAGQLGTHGRATVLAVMLIAAVLVAVNLLALITMRRKDFGRRRALGATRPLIVTLLLTQVALLAALGAGAGTAAALTGLAGAGSPLPGAAFVGAVAVVSVLTAVLAALPPAVIAARRDPVHELRVP